MDTERIYQTWVAIRNTELAVYWTRYNIMVVLNFGVLAATLQAQPGSLINPAPLWLPVGGVLLTSVWLGMTVIGKRLITNRWEPAIQRCEGGFEEEYRLFTEIKNLECAKQPWRKHFENLNIFARLLPILCMLAWLWILSQAL